MAQYNPQKDDISINGRRHSIGRARQMKKEIEQALSIREAYITSELLPEETTVNTRAIEILCTDRQLSDDIPVEVTVGVEEGTVDQITSEKIKGWSYKNDYSPDLGSVVMWQSDVPDFFHEQDCKFSIFKVEFADADIREQYFF